MITNKFVSNQNSHQCAHPHKNVETSALVCAPNAQCNSDITALGAYKYVCMYSYEHINYNCIYVYSVVLMCVCVRVCACVCVCARACVCDSCVG